MPESTREVKRECQAITIPDVFHPNKARSAIGFIPVILNPARVQTGKLADMPSPAPPTPPCPPCPYHRLELYRQSVQHVQAEADFLIRCHRQASSRSGGPTLLREDFCGTAALATHWVSLDENHRALAIDRHGPTLRWAQKQAKGELGDRSQDCILLQGDVMSLSPPQTPKVDLVVALNFSCFIYHDLPALIAYFRQARRSLRPGGRLVIDAFGGPGAMTPGIQRRSFAFGDPASDPPTQELTYQWHQKAFDPVTHRIDCAIHYEGTSPDGSLWRLENAFVYRWRLWTLPELTFAMKQAGFAATEIWLPPPPHPLTSPSPKKVLLRHPVTHARPSESLGSSSSPGAPASDVSDPTAWQDDRYRPVRRSDARYDWVAYVAGVPALKSPP